MKGSLLSQNVLDSLTEGCQVIGRDWKYLYLNNAAARQGRKSREELLGRTMEEAYPGIEATALFPVLRRAMDERLTQVMENEFRFADGSTAWFELRIEPVPEGIFILSLEITERKHSESEWLRLSTAIEQAAEAVILTSAGGEIQYVNPAFLRMTGYTREEVLGKSPGILSSGKHDIAFYKALWATLDAGETWRGQFLNRRRDGSVFTQDTTISPVCDHTGKVVSYVGLGRDVTTEVRLEADLRQSQKMETIGRLAGGIAHDFNNLLSVIIAYADVAMAELTESSPLYDDIRNIRQAGDRAAALTRQLLAFSRKQLLQPAVIDLNAILREVTPLVRRMIGEQIELIESLAPGLGHVKADPAQIEQVVMNLAANARDAMPEGGRLTIGTANAELDETYTSRRVAVRPGRYVMLSVTDTGIGMDEQTMSQVFDPFFTTKPAGKGTGLGMATVYGIVKQSGGSIWVYSEPGNGTTFKIYLPETGGPLEGRKPPLDTARRSHAGETVLLVEDEDAVRRIAQRILVGEGYRVLVAASGPEALELAAGNPRAIDLLLTDVVMPQMNGSELAGRISAGNPGLKVLFMSGYTDDVIVRQGILQPDTQFIGKPFNSDALKRKVREVLDA
jgi:two-component system cell cycle sensor histidine kinase/response regulator CckA